MRTIWLKITALSLLLTFAVAGGAWAHVVVTPEEVPAGEFATLTVSVPTEKEIPTTEIRVEVPEGFTVFGVQPVPGWEHSFEEEGGVISTVTWSGGELRPQEFQQFLLSAQAPEEAGEYPWRAFQTYEDGSVVEWTGSPDSESPASMVEVASAGARDHGHGGGEEGSHHETASASALPDSGGTNPALYGVVGALALALGLTTALLIRRSV